MWVQTGNLPELDESASLTNECFLVRRASPDGQSFRSLGEEIPADFRKKPKSSKHRRDSDDDYENVSNLQITLSSFLAFSLSFVTFFLFFSVSFVKVKAELFLCAGAAARVSFHRFNWNHLCGKVRNFLMLYRLETLLNQNQFFFSGLLLPPSGKTQHLFLQLFYFSQLLTLDNLVDIFIFYEFSLLIIIKTMCWCFSLQAF